MKLCGIKMKRISVLLRGKKHIAILAILAIIVMLFLIIPLRLFLAGIYHPLPEAIFTLGGEEAREEHAAKLSLQYPDLDIFVSSGLPENQARSLFSAYGISEQNVYIDSRAYDTVTNFTTMVGLFKKRKIHHVYLVTSDCHMARAEAIATIIFGSHGITFTPVSYPSSRQKESFPHLLFDVCRSILWLLTGFC
jgi:uncharacterized SAM-binding protein YcdF (DUF218 family)